MLRTRIDIRMFLLHRATLMALFCFTLVMSEVATAAPHAEITVMPLGGVTVKRGVQELVIPLPPYRPLPPLVFAGVQPVVQPLANPNAEVDEAAAAKAPPPMQVPGTIKFKLGNRQLPDWILGPIPSAYIISPDAIRATAGFQDGVLRIEAHLLTEADGVELSKLAMPDPMLLAEDGTLSLSGPHIEFQRRAAKNKEKEVEKYFAAQAAEFAGDLELARNGYQILATSANQDVARFARRGLRLLNYRLRPRKLSGNFLEHYRWGHYLRFAGLYGTAHGEFAECRLLYPKHFGAQYYAGDTLAMLPRGMLDWLVYFDRAGLAIEDEVTEKSRLDIAVVVVRQRSGVELTDNQIAALKDSIICLERIINVASRGRIEMVSRWHELPNAETDKLTLSAGGVLAPNEQLIRPGGWFDVTITALPRLNGEAASEFVVSEEALGATSAYAANIFHDAELGSVGQVYYELLRRLARHVPGLAGLPDRSSLAQYGLRPNRDSIAPIRAVLHDRCPPNDLTGIQVAEPGLDESFLRLWRVKAFDESAFADVMEMLATGTPASVEQGEDLVIDQRDLQLQTLLKPKTAGLIASTWAYVPNNQSIQARIELQSINALQLFVNGRLHHAGLRAGEDRQSMFSRVAFQSGWNLLQFAIKPIAGKDSALAMSILDINGRPIGGFANAYKAPEDFRYRPTASPAPGMHFEWNSVRDDWHRLLPELTMASLPGFEKWSVMSDGDRYVGFVNNQSQASDSYLPKTEIEVQAAFDDVRLNNVIDWRREWCALLAGANDRQLLLVRPEGLPAILHCLKEVEALPDRLNSKSISQRLLGYIEFDVHDSRQPIFVFDVAIGPKKTWPTDEEDLLAPSGHFVPNSQLFPEIQGPVQISGN